jgi:DNA-binding MarR family transcriptional regulator
MSLETFRIAHKIYQLAHVQIARFTDITMTQIIVLDAIEKHPDMSQTDVVELTGVDRSTLADIIKRLVKRGYIARVDNKADARAYQLRLTAEGRKALHGARKGLDKAATEFSRDVIGIEKVSFPARSQ